MKRWGDFDSSCERLGELFKKKNHFLTGIMHTMNMTRKNNEPSKNDSHMDVDP
jgi:hypothetical protein